MGQFDNAVAVVTGGASGIGAAIARRLIDEGAAVAVMDLSVDGVSSEYFAIAADVSNDASVRSAISAVVERFGQLDVLVNNAGVGAQGDVSANEDSEWHRVWDINVVGIARVTRAALPHLRRSTSPAVVNLSSIVATAGLPERVLYTATKGAVLAMTRAMAADHISEGIRFNSVNPGTTDTPWVESLLKRAADPIAERDALEKRQPHGRLVTADEVAGAVLYLASPLSGSTTGASISVDGGMNDVRPRPR